MSSDRRVAIVTGAASGMGRATALRLGAQGFAIAALDRNKEGLEATGEFLRRQESPFVLLPLDVSDRTAVNESIDQASRLGRVWFLAAAAGVLQGAFAIDADEAHFEHVIGVNLMGVVWTNAAAARAMIRHGQGGRIVNWSSRGAVGGNPGYSAYCAAKAAVCSFTQCLALELGPSRITVNAILPGSVRTPMVGYHDKEYFEKTAANIPLGRWGEPEDVAGLAAFFASDDASWITGVTWSADGGGLAAMGAQSVEQAKARLARESDYHRQGVTRVPGE